MEKTQRNKDGRCRINALPDALLHHVLSFMDMKQLVHASLISRKWRYLWTTLRTLNFDYTLWKIKPLKFYDFVENVFLLRDGSSPEKFKITKISPLDMEKINKWLIIASRKQIPQVDLQIFSLNVVRNATEVTPLIFTSPVQVIEIKSWRGEKYNMQLPNAICCATYLKTLSLKSIRLPKGDSTMEVTFKCHVLEKLVLEGCYYDHLRRFNIYIPKLKILTVKNMYREIVNSVGSCKIRISTPNLTTLWLNYCSFDNYVIENCDSVVSARVELAYGTLLCDEGKASLGSLKNVTWLQLSGWAQKLCLALQDRLDKIPDIFCNLKSLTLMSWPQPSGIHALASLLSRSINIEYLFLNFFQENFDATILMGDMEKLFSLEWNFRQLKSVEIQNFAGWQVEMKLVEIVLKNAIKLEEVTVKVHPRRNTRQGLKECMGKIASLHAIILVLPP